MKIYSRYKTTNNNFEILKIDPNIKNYSLCVHNFYILIAMTSKSVDYFKIQNESGFNSDDIIELLNKLFNKYKKENENTIFVIGPGICWEAKYIASMTKKIPNKYNNYQGFKQTGQFCGTFHNLIQNNNFNVIYGFENTYKFMKPFDKLMILFENYLKGKSVCGHQFVSNLISSEFQHFIFDLYIDQLFESNSNSNNNQLSQENYNFENGNIMSKFNLPN